MTTPEAKEQFQLKTYGPPGPRKVKLPTPREMERQLRRQALAVLRSLPKG